MAVVMPGLERRLRAELTGEVQFDAFSRGRYSTDASHYQIMPVGVVAPRTIEEADRAIAIARSEGATVLARGGGFRDRRTRHPRRDRRDLDGRR